MRWLQILALLGAFFPPIAQAQMRGMAGAVSQFRTSFANRPISHPGTVFLGAPFLYADYPAQVVQSSPPQVVIVQPASQSEAPPEAKSEPLLIELQGTRYVRFGGKQQTVPPDYTEPVTQRQIQPELPPAILIFRDGHREQAPEYAIVGATLYARGDYWQTGHWTRNIQLSALNLPATIQANHDAGIKFILPSAPNEIVTRP